MDNRILGLRFLVATIFLFITSIGPVMASDVVLTGYIRYAEKVKTERGLKARYIVEVKDVVFESWDRKYVDARLSIETMTQPLLYNKGDFLILKGERDPQNDDVIGVSQLYLTDPMESVTQEILPVWMGIFIQKLQIALQSDLEYAYKEGNLENIPFARWQYRIQRNRKTFDFKNTNVKSHDDLTKLIEWRIQKMFGQIDGLIPDVFTEFISIKIVNENISVLQDDRNFTRSYNSLRMQQQLKN